jgi:predicted RNase H-like nuclease (RuvC/YqgF family)
MKRQFDEVEGMNKKHCPNTNIFIKNINEDNSYKIQSLENNIIILQQNVREMQEIINKLYEKIESYENLHSNNIKNSLFFQYAVS